MITWEVCAADDDGWHVTFTAHFRDGARDIGVQQFRVVVPTQAPIVTDAAGRLRTRSGRWLPPVVEVDGEWRPRAEDPADPWARQPRHRADVEQLIEQTCRGYAGGLAPLPPTPRPPVGGDPGAGA